MKYIYLIQSLENSYYKIGISKDPEIRIQALQTGNSSQLKMICKFLTEHANKIEKALHRKYSYLKKDGEWFNLPLNIEIDFINECKIIEKNIDFLISRNNIFC